MLETETPAPAVTPPAGNPRFPLVDSMRGIAAGMIVIIHVAGAVYGPVSPSHIWTYLVRFDLGVTIFFLISGFLLYRPFVAARLEGRPPIRVRDYARRRMLRIVPAYWVALTLLGAWPGLAGLWDHGWWKYYAFLQVYSAHTLANGIPPAWTLCIEISFYVALPFLAAGLAWLGRGLPRRQAIRREILALLALIGISILLQATAFAPLASVPTTTLPPYLDWFAYGMLLATLSVAWHPPPRVVQMLVRPAWLPWLGAGIVFWFLCTQLGLSTDGYIPVTLAQALERHFLYALCAALLLLPALFCDAAGGWPRRLLANRFMAWLGLISYSVFLFHYPIVGKLAQHGAATWLPGSHVISLLVPVAAVTLAVAASSYYIVERPALRLKDRSTLPWRRARLHR